MRASGTCHYCDADAEFFDHIVPKSLGGSDLPRNLTPTCRPCNGRKGARWPTCECFGCETARRRELVENSRVAPLLMERMSRNARRALTLSADLGLLREQARAITGALLESGHI